MRTSRLAAQGDARGGSGEGGVSGDLCDEAEVGGDANVGGGGGGGGDGGADSKRQRR